MSRSTSLFARRQLQSAGLLIAGVTLAGCRSDSLTSSEPPRCDDRPTCAASVAAPVTTGSVMIAALDDAASRIAPSLLDVRTRADVGPALQSLRADLLAGRADMARESLAVAYAAVQAGKDRSVQGSDVADLDAIRLSLVPAADALGVAAR